MGSEPEYGSLEYVGSGKPEGFTRWRDPITGGEIDLHPTTVLRQGLTDKLRAAYQEAVDYESEHGQTRARVPTKQRLAPEKPEDASQAIPDRYDVPHVINTHMGEPAGGHTDEWRWDFVRDGDELLMVIDNRPKLRAAPDGEPIPDLQKAVLPVDLLKQVLDGV